MKERLDYIDRAKGILIILMVIGHIWQSGFVFDMIYAFHMPAFFVISGMLMHYTKSYQKSFGKFLLRKIFSYGIPFLWIELLGVLTDILRNGVTLNVKGYLFNTVTFHFNDPNLWFLVDLFLIEVLVAGMLKIIKKTSIICCTSAVLFFVRYLLPTQYLYVSTVSSVMKYLPLFIAGFYGHKYWKKVHIPSAVLCGGAVLGCVLFGSYIMAAGRLWDDLVYMFGGFCGTYAVLCISQKCNYAVTDRALAYAGKNTLIIYGTHHIYYAAIGALLGITDFASTPLGLGMLMLVGVTVLEIPTIYVINRWLPFLAGKYRKRTGTA